MADLRDLYQEVILDHGKKPRNFGTPSSSDRKALGHNPLCGDKFTLFVSLDGELITDVHFDGSGCAISVASASILTETLVGKTMEEAEAVFERFHAMVTGEGDASDLDALGKLTVFKGVSEFPIRVKCATLAWHTVQAALKQSHDTVSTE